MDKKMAIRVAEGKCLRKKNMNRPSSYDKEKENPFPGTEGES